MARRRVSNPLALAVLTLLDERPMHPYEMSTTLRERRKGDSIRLNYGSLYSVVEALARHGLIEAQETVRDGRRPERTVYAITDAGRVEVTDWLSELVSTPEKEFTRFEAALSLLGALPVDDAVRLLRIRLDTLTMQAHTDRAMRESFLPDFPRIFLIEGEFAAALRDAEIEFLRRLLADIESGALTGVDVWRRLHQLRGTQLTPAEIDATIGTEFPVMGHLSGRADAKPTGSGEVPPETS